MTEQKVFTDEELKAAQAEINRRARENRKREEDEHRRLARERYKRIELELRVKYSAEAGLTIDEFMRLEDIFDSYAREREDLL